ncbi:MAG: isoprenylcysteine carboxylmethyltransferase family protein [Pseudomonadota bacterium]
MHLKIPPPIIGLLSALAIGGLHKVFTGLSLSFPFQTALAVLVAATGLVFDLTALRSFLKQKTTVDPRKPDHSSALVTNGVYRISRNPMYLGLLLLLTAWTIYLGTPLGAFVLIAFVIYLTEFQIRPEEKILREKFGADFGAYCEAVRRWM